MLVASGSQCRSIGAGAHHESMAAQCTGGPVGSAPEPLLQEAVPMLAGAKLCSVGHDVELGEGSDEACAVCLAAMCGGETVLHLKCGHTFHCACIGSWLRHQQLSIKAPTCPVCRADAAPRECCKRTWTDELSLTTQPNKEPSSEVLVRRAAAEHRRGPRLYLLVLILCVAIVVWGSSGISLYDLPQMDGSSSSSEESDSLHRRATYTYSYGGSAWHDTNVADAGKWQLHG